MIILNSLAGDAAYLGISREEKRAVPVIFIVDPFQLLQELFFRLADWIIAVLEVLGVVCYAVLVLVASVHKLFLKEVLGDRLEQFRVGMVMEF